MSPTVCDRCRVATVADAKFCHQCGQRLERALVDIDVGAGQQIRASAEPAQPAPTSRGRTLAATLLAVGVLAGLVYTFSRSDEPDPDEQSDPGPEAQPDTEPTVSADPPTPTTTTARPNPSALTAAGDLTWRAGPEVGEGFPLGFVELGEATFFFAAGKITPYGFREDGLQAWRSTDGSAWDSLGWVLSAELAVNAVAATPEGLVAVGTDAGKAPTAWHSIDGVEWTARALTTPTELEGQRVVPETITSSAQRTIIAGSLRDELSYRAIVEAVEATFDLDEELFGPRVAWSYGSSASTEVTISGPFGITLLTTTDAELGINTDKARDANGDWSANSVVWSSEDGTSWEGSVLRQFSVRDALTLPDESFLLTGHANGGPQAWSSADGVTWEPTTIPISAATRWGSRVIGDSGDGNSRLLLSEPNTTTEWEPIGVGQLLPEDLSTFVVATEAADAGVALLIQGWAPGPDEVTRPLASLTKDGITLTVGGNNGPVLLEGDGIGVTSVDFRTTPERYRVDLDEATITLLEVDGSTPLVTYTISELQELERRSLPEIIDDGRRFLAFSADGQSWSVDDLERVSSASVVNSALLVTDEQLTVAMATISGPNAWQTETPIVRLFTAEIPG